MNKLVNIHFEVFLSNLPKLMVSIRAHNLIHNFYISNVRRKVLIEFSALEIRLGCRFLLYVLSTSIKPTMMKIIFHIK